MLHGVRFELEVNARGWGEYKKVQMYIVLANMTGQYCLQNVKPCSTLKKVVPAFCTTQPSITQTIVSLFPKYLLRLGVLCVFVLFSVLDCVRAILSLCP